VQEWLSMTEWSQDLPNEEIISEVQEQLFELELIPKITKYENLVYKL